MLQSDIGMLKGHARKLVAALVASGPSTPSPFTPGFLAMLSPQHIYTYTHIHIYTYTDMLAIWMVGTHV